MLDWMRGATKMLSARHWWTVVGLVLLLALLWSVAIMLAWPTTVPLIGSIVLLAGATIALLVERHRALQNAAELEKSIRSQVEDQLYSVRPERRQQIEQIEREFATAVETLKRSKVGKRQRGSAALYALPWYVVVGPPAAGKTSAIVESGLDFPLGTNRVRGVGGTRNCDWFFSTSAIFLDTAGRYMAGEEDRDEWYKFLELLRRHRRQAPVNGVLLMMNIDQVLMERPDELQRTALELRMRVNELIDRLGVKFPVYIVFTKVDLVRGFSEFFQLLERKERGQVWGFTLTRDQQREGIPKDQFEREFDLLSKSLVDLRSSHVRAAEPGSDAAREAYLFPLEFAAARESLTEFIGQLFHPDPYRENPDFRGAYFTSSLQEGVAVDRVLRSVADRFGLARWDPDHPAAAAESRSYFLTSLFGDVIMRDRDRVVPTSRTASTRRLVERALIAATAVLVLGFGWVAGRAYARSASDLGVVRRAVDRANANASLQSLDSLERAITLLERSNSTSHRLGRLGLDRSAEVLPELRVLFAKRARPLLHQSLLQPIEDRLRADIAVDSAPGLPDAKSDLHAYRLLGSDVRRLRDSVSERTFLKDYFRRLLSAHPGDSIYTNRFVDVLGDPALATDSTLVASVQRLLYSPPTVDGLYRELRDEGARRLPAVTIVNLLGPSSSFVFVPTAQVPGFFTRAGWETFVQDEIEKRSQEPGRADWVLGSKPENLPPELTDAKHLAEELLQRYFNDYVTAWQRFLGGLAYTAKDVQSATVTLNALADPAKSPLVALLDSVNVQTRFENAVLASSRRKASDFIAAALKNFGFERAAGAGQPSNPVDRYFAPLHALRDNNNSALLGQIQAQYATFGQRLQAVGGGAMTPAVADQIVVESRTARITVGGLARSVDPSIRRAILEQPFEIGESAITRGGLENASREWRDQVCKPFDAALGSKYPFDGRGPDASLADIERFFQPQMGTIWVFYDKELSSYLRGPDFEPPAGGAPGLSPSPAVIAALRRAKIIRDGFFAGSGGLHLEFDLTPELPVLDQPPGGKASVTEVCIIIDGHRECYRNGSAYATTFTWPLKMQPGATITATVREGKNQIPFKLEQPGELGWLRLLDNASVTRVAGGKFRLEWRVGQQGTPTVHVIYILTPKSATHPFGNLRVFSQFDCPPTLQ